MQRGCDKSNKENSVQFYRTCNGTIKVYIGVYIMQRVVYMCQYGFLQKSENRKLYQYNVNCHKEKNIPVNKNEVKNKYANIRNKIEKKMEKKREK